MLRTTADGEWPWQGFAAVARVARALAGQAPAARDRAPPVGRGPAAVDREAATLVRPAADRARQPVPAPAGAGVRVLPGAQWRARERALYRVLHGIELETGPRGWLILPRWPGVVLADYARSRLDPAPARLQGLGAASRALAGPASGRAASCRRGCANA